MTKVRWPTTRKLKLYYALEERIGRSEQLVQKLVHKDKRMRLLQTVGKLFQLHLSPWSSGRNLKERR